MSTQLPIDAYRDLSRWFPALSDRARALGMNRDTLSEWERAQLDYRVRPATAENIQTLESVARDVEQLMGDPRATGRWMLTPQPQLRGETPARLVRERRLRELAELIFQGKTPGPRRVIRNASAPTTTSVPPVTVRTRPRAADKAAVLRILGQNERIIRPVQR